MPDNQCNKGGIGHGGGWRNAIYRSTGGQWKVCAVSESDTCKCKGTVIYGKRFVKGRPGHGEVASPAQVLSDKHKQKKVDGSIKCNNAAFGDPLPGILKRCLCDAVEPSPSPPPSEPVECTDTESEYMSDNGLTCDTYSWMYKNRCNSPAEVNGARDAWVQHKWCQKSCFLHGNGYQGDACKVSISDQLAAAQLWTGMSGITAASFLLLIFLTCMLLKKRSWDAPANPEQGCIARWFGDMSNLEDKTVKCYYHKVSINSSGEEEFDTTVVRVPLNMGDAQALEDVLVREGLDAGEDWTGDGSRITYEDSDHDQVTITSSSKLGDVRQHAQKIHIFQTVTTAKAVEAFEVEQNMQNHEDPTAGGEFSPY